MTLTNEKLLAGQHVVVVGGGSGIGLATAVAAIGHGARVSLVGKDREQLVAAAATLPGDPTAHRWAVADVLEEQALRSVFAEGGPVDHIYISAGSAQLGSILDEETVDDQLRGLRVRLQGSAHVVRAAHPVLRSDGSITVTGGVSTDRPVRGAWVSNVGTAAAEQLARSLALELAPIRVNAISPGWTDTPMWHTVLGEQREAVLEQARQGQLTGRLSTSAEVAAGVLALMTNPSVTGAILHVDGGSRLT
jgi:NAD(P)-dependent dehydrogenase (short-subunit alcohol dehydrogenase family)